MTLQKSPIESILDEVVAGIYKKYPQLLQRFGEQGRQKCREDNQHHIHHLETAYQVEDPAIFVDYAIWLNDILCVRGMKPDHLIDNFERIAIAVEGKLDPEQEKSYKKALESAITALQKREESKWEEDCDNGL
ncbi:hypothetical protein [Sediminibacillus massiliensis]|uniref:hypothetical protein n=1 Tax=Sediminibacillus massiliensis TaxID=1926277 RepID=UPI0009884FF6|nr:hypothetical protein [Sediminibacillus massiliensis]